MRYFARLLVLVSLAVIPAVVSAQINTGKISGFVTDPSGAVVAGIAVTATNDGTGVITKA